MAQRPPALSCFLGGSPPSGAQERWLGSRLCGESWDGGPLDLPRLRLVLKVLPAIEEPEQGKQLGRPKRGASWCIGHPERLCGFFSL